MLQKIDVRGGIVTIDAMGTQKGIAEEIIRGKADYVLALKRNHETLHQAVIDHIAERLEGSLEGTQELTTSQKKGDVQHYDNVERPLSSSNIMIMLNVPFPLL